jgi:glycine hydroxymethyltransferase
MNNVFELIEKERQRQEDEICLIASENYMSTDVLKASGTVLINKYSEGYPNKRYYGGCRVIDEIEQLAIDRACELFGCKYANVQPNSGCQANQAVYMAVCKPGDTILAMGVNEGGHISHSLSIGFAGTFYNVVEYGLTDDGFLNYDELKEKLYSKHPRLLIVGGSAYPREIDFKKIREIVDEYNKTVYEECIQTNNTVADELFKNKNCVYMVDMAHIAGLIATKEHMSPFPYADVVTSTVQKTLRSGRGGLILTNDEQLIKKINSAVFPRLQGGPLNNMIAAKAVGFGEALQPEFKQYIQQVLKNIKSMEEVFNERNIKMVSNGSDNHLILLDLRDKGISGKQLEDALSDIGIVVNKNAVKDDPLPKTETSGVRIGTACITTRGAKENMAEWIAHKICDVIDILTDTYDYSRVEMLRKAMPKVDHLSDKELILENIKGGVKYFCEEHPIYK